MEALVSDRLLLRHSVFSPSSGLGSANPPAFSCSFRRRRNSRRRAVAAYCSTFASPDTDASAYGGWDEMDLLEENADPGNLEPFRSFLLSLGIDGKRHALPFLLGLSAALAASRVRFSTAALLPISALVFFCGYVAGTAKVGAAVQRSGGNGGALGAFDLKLKELEALFSDLDGKMAFLRKEIEGLFTTEGYLQIVEHTRAAISQVQTSLREFDFEPDRMNQKPSRKRAKSRAADIDFFKFLTGMLHEPLMGPKDTKSKNTSKEKIRAEEQNSFRVEESRRRRRRRSRLGNNMISFHEELHLHDSVNNGIQAMMFEPESRKLKDQHINEFDFGEEDDAAFEWKLNEGAILINRAREYMLLSRVDEQKADAMLYEAAELLSAAVVMRPMSLVAVGQLGNAHLLHGELKLKVSRELRTLLSRTVKDMASSLVSVCEECEGLLVEAGRRYRRALSIDEHDVRALYNWGLALCFRAQLVADVGPKAAVDADELYLAAIDKFNAMMSRSNAYAPDALYRWGIALQQRSRLRSKNSREKTRLLHQAKAIFEDALYMESGNQLVRNALVSCVSELNYNQF